MSESCIKQSLVYKCKDDVSMNRSLGGILKISQYHFFHDLCHVIERTLSCPPTMILLSNFQKMPRRRALIQKGVNYNEGQARPAPNDPLLVKQVTNVEFRAAIFMLVQVMTI